jgi:hypothetical protein
MFYVSFFDISFFHLWFFGQLVIFLWPFIRFLHTEHLGGAHVLTVSVDGSCSKNNEDKVV